MQSSELRLPESGWRILYAFAVVWMATFAALAIFRQPNRHEFVSSSMLKFNLPASNVDPQEFARIAHDASQAVVNEATLVRLAAQAARRTGIALADLPATEQLQQAIQVVLKNEPVATISISLVGDGKSHELVLVNALASELAVEMARQHDGRFVQQWMRDFDSSVDATRTVHLTAQLQEEIDTVERQLTEYEDALTAQQTPGELTEQMKRLNAELSALLAAGHAETDPHVVSLRQQLEWLRPQVAGLPGAEPAPEDPGPLAPVLENRRKNPYFTASERRPTMEPIATVTPTRAAIHEVVNLSKLRGKTSALMAETESVLDRKGDLAAQLTNYFAAGSPLVAALSEIRWAEQPRVRAGRNALPVSAVVFSCLLAAAAAYLYDPTQDRRQLRTLSEVSRRLGVEILGRLPTESTRTAPRPTALVAAKCIRCSEWIVCLTLIVVGLACCAKPMLAQTFLQDPVYGLSHWFALVLS